MGRCKLLVSPSDGVKMSDIPQDETTPMGPEADSALPPLGLTAGYWQQSRQPLASLIFIAPLLVIYEVGVLLPAAATARNGVDVWLRALLDWIGFGQYFLLPVLTVCILLGWHYTTHQPWRISWRVLPRMGVECLVLAICLLLLLQLQHTFLQTLMTLPAETAVALNIPERLGNLIMFLGAGIYEELLFRLILLSAAIWILRRFGLDPTSSIVYAVGLTSLLFAAAHHVGTYGEPFYLFHFLSRFAAGVFFCVLFVYRGFGIAAGTHALYDILVGLLP